MKVSCSLGPPLFARALAGLSVGPRWSSPGLLAGIDGIFWAMLRLVSGGAGADGFVGFTYVSKGKSSDALLVGLRPSFNSVYA